METTTFNLSSTTTLTTTTTTLTTFFNLTTTTFFNMTDDEGEGQKPGPLISLAVPLLMCSAGVLGNVVALAMLWRSRREHAQSVFYRLVAGLALTDLLGILALSPVTILTYSNGLKWVGGQPVCHYYSFMMILAGLATVLLVLCMAVERCLSLLSPYFYQRHVAPEKVKAVLLSVWVLSALISGLPLVSVGHNVLHYPGTWCFFDYLSDNTLDKVFSVGYASIGLSVIATTAICNFAVMMVLLRMRRVSQNIGKSREGRTVTNMTSEMQMIFFLAGIILVFATCYCPLMVRVLINVSRTVPLNVEADLMAIRLASLNQILDPWVYLLLRRRLAALLYSACRSVSPLHKASLMSEVFSNSPRNSPARPRAALCRLLMHKHGGSEASLKALKKEEEEESPVQAKKKQQLEESLPLNTESAQQPKAAGYLALSGDSERRGDAACSSGTAVSPAFLTATSPCGEGSRSPEAERDQTKDGASPSAVASSDQKGGSPSADKERGHKEAAIPTDAQEHHRPERTSSDLASLAVPPNTLPHLAGSKDTGGDTNPDTTLLLELPEQPSPEGSSRGLSGTAAEVAVAAAAAENKDSAVPNGTLADGSQGDCRLPRSGVMAPSASWPVVCVHGKQQGVVMVSMEEGAIPGPGPACNKRHSSVDTSCTLQCHRLLQAGAFV